MYVARRHHRLMKLLAKLHNPLVERNQIFLRVNIPVPLRRNHKLIISNRLYLQIIIKLYNFGNPLIALPVKKCPEQLSRFAGASDNQSLSVLFNQRFRNQRTFIKIRQMRCRNQLVQINPARLIFGKNDNMIRVKLAHRIHTRFAKFIQCRKRLHTVLFQHCYQFNENLRRTLCIVHRTMMIFKRYAKRLCHRVKRIFRLPRKQRPRSSHGIHIRKIRRNPLPLCVLLYKTHVKACIMRDQNRIPHKRKKLRKHSLNRLRFHYHTVVNACQLFNLKRYRYFRIDKR